MSTLGPQFLNFNRLSELHAGDFSGKIGDPEAVQRLAQYNNAAPRREYGDHGGPAEYVQHLAQTAQQQGGAKTFDPITVAHYQDGSSKIWDGHHRALAAHSLGQGIPAEHWPIEELRGY